MKARIRKRRLSRRYMLIPKGHWTGKRCRADVEFRKLADALGPRERRAMRQIAKDGDMFEVHGIHYLVAPVTLSTFNALAEFEAWREDMEPDGSLEDDRDNDNAFDRVHDRIVDGDREPDLGWGHHPDQTRLDIGTGDEREEQHDDTEPDYRHGPFPAPPREGAGVYLDGRVVQP